MQVFCNLPFQKGNDFFQKPNIFNFSVLYDVLDDSCCFCSTQGIFVYPKITLIFLTYFPLNGL